MLWQKAMNIRGFRLYACKEYNTFLLMSIPCVIYKRVYRVYELVSIINASFLMRHKNPPNPPASIPQPPTISHIMKYSCLESNI